MFLIGLSICFQTVAHAYLGPGIGAGTIAIALGFLGSILLAIFALLYYPFKRMFKRKHKNNNEGLKDKIKVDEVDEVDEDDSKAK